MSSGYQTGYESELQRKKTTQNICVTTHCTYSGYEFWSGRNVWTQKINQDDFLIIFGLYRDERSPSLTNEKKNYRRDIQVILATVHELAGSNLKSSILVLLDCGTGPEPPLGQFRIVWFLFRTTVPTGSDHQFKINWFKKKLME